MKKLVLLLTVVLCAQFALADSLIYGYRNGHYTPISAGSGRSINYGYRNGIYTPISVKQSGHYRQSNTIQPHYRPNTGGINYGYRNGHYVPIKVN